MEVLVASTASARQVPDFNQLLARETVFSDQEPGKSAIDPPAPALAATRSPLLRIVHAILIDLLFTGRQRQIVEAHGVLCDARYDIVGVWRYLRNPREFLSASTCSP